MKLLLEPTILRSILKVGGGYLIAKGFADESAVNELIGALLAVWAIVWGLISAHEKKKLQAQSGQSTTTPGTALMLAAALAFAPFAFTGCQTSNAPGRVLASTVTTVSAAMEGWWTWEALGQAKPEEVARVRELYARYQAVEAVAEKAYVTAAKLDDQTAWRQASEALRSVQTELLSAIEAFTHKKLASP